MKTGAHPGANDTGRSAVYTGWLRHRRFAPVRHAFTYPVFMLYLDLDEVETLFRDRWYCSVDRPNILSFHRSDYFDPGGGDLKTAVLRRVTAALREEGVSAEGIEKVMLLTHARIFNILFNPVSFYYCFDAAGRLRAILAEITNTPWGERHAYVLPVDPRDDGTTRHTFRFGKQFHVSPFNPMEMHYTWRFNEPGAALLVHMDNHAVTEGGDKHFDATLKLGRREFRAGLPRALIRYPFMTVKVITGIYWQAFRLWRKGARFYPHPAPDGAPDRRKQVLSDATIRQEQTK